MFGGVLLPSFFGTAIIMVMIICHVRGRIAAVVRYRVRPQLDHTARQTVIQSLLYIMACLLPNALLLAHQFFTLSLATQQETARFVFSLFIKLIIPLQGLFNLIIYVRPRYISLRRKKGDSLSFFSLMSEIVVGEKARPLEAIEDPLTDDFAPELAVPGGRSESNSDIVDKDHSSTQDVENVDNDTEDGNVMLDNFGLSRVRNSNSDRWHSQCADLQCLGVGFCFRRRES